MLTTVEIPHLAPGQKLKNYVKDFKAATATYKVQEQLACLPLYIHRTAGEKELAHQAASKNTIDEAFTFLEELIDGTPSQYIVAEEFFSMKPKDQSIDSVRSYYFQLYETSVIAGFPSDVFLQRFFTNIVGGKKLYDSFKQDVKENLDQSAIAGLFKKMMEKMKKKLAGGPEIKEEPEFVFNFNHTPGNNEPTQEESLAPQWAKDLQEEVKNIRSQLEGNNMGEYGDHSETSEAYPIQSTKNKFSKSKNQNSKVSCNICKKTGHMTKNCFKRNCFKCGGKGHEAKTCPSQNSFNSNTRNYSTQ